MKNINCTYCQKETEYIDSEYIYWKSFWMVYICKNCDAYCWVHKWTNKPYWTVANKELRELRKEAHRLFDPRWKDWKLNRKQSYNWLSQKLWIKYQDTHIWSFDKNLCEKTIAILSNK